MHEKVSQVVEKSLLKIC